MNITEPVEQILDAVGENLEFSAATIKGIPGFSLVVLQGDGNLYDVEKQQFSFMLSSLDVEANSIVEDDTFTMDDTVYTYTFRVTNTPVPNLAGWSKCPVVFKGKESNV